jgi:hypothetical protein
MHRLKALGAALLVTAVLVVCSDYVAFAATGRSFILGKANYASSLTSLSRTTSGAALSLRTLSAGSAPLVTNARGRVANLNSDLLDGLDSSAFLRTTSSVNADRLDGLDSTAFVLRRSPVTLLVAAPLPNRELDVGTTDTVIQSIDVTVPDECGAAGTTQHSYLIEEQGSWSASGQVVEVFLTVDSVLSQAGPGDSLVQPNTYATSASSRVVTLGPGDHTLRTVAKTLSATARAHDPALYALDLGYVCATTATTATAPAGTVIAGPGPR